jgi:tetratricopeptide (TPR) repeat protein
MTPMAERAPRGEVEPMSAGVVRPGRWRRWRRPLAAGAVLAAGAAAGIICYLRRPPLLDCETARRRDELNSTVVRICRDEYERTRRPATGARLAEALLLGESRAEASALAGALLATEARADALHLLGRLDLEAGRLDAAFGRWQEARQLHRAQGRHDGVARDALGLAGVHDRRSHLSEALYALDECIAEARAASDPATEGRGHLGAARTLTDVGQYDEARHELDRAQPLLASDVELAQLWSERGNVYQEESRGQERASHEEQALAAFQQAQRYAERARSTRLLIPIELNLAFSLAELRRTEEAERQLETVTTLDRNRDYTSELQQLQARIAYRRNNLALASSLNTRVYPSIKIADDRFEICVMQARIALAASDLAAAETWARRGIDEVEQIRIAEPTAELRPWMLATRRAPYELLFTVYARAGRLEDAVRTLDQWQGRSLLDAMSRPGTASPDLQDRARQLQRLEQWLPAAAAAAAPLISSDGNTAALRSIDLLALAVAEGDVWRVVSRRGEIRIDKLGPLAALSPQLDELRARPWDRAVAGAAGELLVPPELFEGTATLHVLLDAKLAGLPVAALRRGGKALPAVRPLLYVPRLPTRTGAACAAPPAPGAATVLADSRGDLPGARHEAEVVAARFGAAPRVGAGATSAALLGAAPGSILHVAVHAGVDTGGGILQLHDRQVSALEILSRKLGPPLAVLTGCGTAGSGDPELARSLATAFLANGSPYVVATLRPIADAGPPVAEPFYRHGGARDPVRALAAAQAELSSGDSHDWPSFAVFGTCAP